MKYLILLLLTPLLIAQSNEDVWADYIENYEGELTNLVCTSTGTETRRIGTVEKDMPLSSNDFYIFNEDHLFARVDEGGYKTDKLMVKGDVYPNWMVVNNNQIVSAVFIATDDVMKAISTDEYQIKKLTSSFVINRLTGFYTKKGTVIRFMYELGEDYNADVNETGKCEVYDPNVKKF